MKTERNILVAFILNLSFSIFEFIGGIFTGSVAIMSDALHDLGDALSIGLSYFFERKSKAKPDERYTYGYIRYSVIGGFITTLILVLGSIAVIYNAVCRLISPVPIDYNGMILFAVVGAAVNFAAAYFTKEGDSINQKAVNLHMLEDVIGWCVVLIGAMIMRFTNISVLDPLLSISLSIFIIFNAIKNLKSILDLFLEKVPGDIELRDIKAHLCKIEGIIDIHHLHIWSIDGCRHNATMHIVTDRDPQAVKELVRRELTEHHIVHCTLETESTNDICHQLSCVVEPLTTSAHHHNHHHHH